MPEAFLSSASNAPLEDRLETSVRGFQRSGFRLGHDLACLGRLLQNQAPEGAIFYCARVQEALALAALERMGLPPHILLFNNLETLVAYRMLPPITRCWAHALRRLGNTVRHIHRAITIQEADLAVVFLERWLHWYFCDFVFGDRLPHITQDKRPLHDNVDRELRRLALFLDQEQISANLVEKLLRDDDRAFWTLPEFAAVLAELSLDRKLNDAARQLLQLGRQKFPDNLRLRQLEVLWYSRNGLLEQALELADKTKFTEAEFNDDESLGIFAGIHKRLWDRSPTTNGRHLETAHQLYKQGWKRGRYGNPYLGINAAATALWLDRPQQARRLAGEVRDLLRDRRAALAETTNQHVGFDHWDQMTLAEAELLLGRIANAKQLYDVPDRHEVSQAQAERNLKIMGLHDAIAHFWEKPTPVNISPDSKGAKFSVGVTGHRRLPVEEAFTRQFAGVMTELAQFGPLCCLSALAAGADQRVARAILDYTPNGQLQAVLPLEHADYRDDFSPEEYAEFARLLARAHTIEYPPQRRETGKLHGDDRNAAYEWAGHYVVDHGDILFAIWDGAAARGRGGTADIVARARQCRHPIIWLCTLPPYQVVRENWPPVSTNPGS